MPSRSPRYLDVAAILQDEINLLAPNSLLPTEQQLAKRFGVSRITVRGALDLLEKSGLVSRLRGRGTTVSPPKVTRHFAPLQSFEQDLASQGIDFETRVLAFDPKSTAPDLILDRLRLPSNGPVGYLSLTRLVDDRIVCHDGRYYPPEVAQRLKPERVIEHDASKVLEDLVGIAYRAGRLGKRNRLGVRRDFRGARRRASDAGSCQYLYLAFPGRSADRGRCHLLSHRSLQIPLRGVVPSGDSRGGENARTSTERAVAGCSRLRGAKHGCDKARHRHRRHLHRHHGP